MPWGSQKGQNASGSTGEPRAERCSPGGDGGAGEGAERGGGAGLQDHEQRKEIRGERGRTAMSEGVGAEDEGNTWRTRIFGVCLDVFRCATRSRARDYSGNSECRRTCRGRMQAWRRLLKVLRRRQSYSVPPYSLTPAWRPPFCAHRPLPTKLRPETENCYALIGPRHSGRCARRFCRRCSSSSRRRRTYMTREGAGCGEHNAICIVTSD